jgi:hypothetical protein
MLEALLLRWLHHFHGAGADNQHDYYECRGCARIITHARIALGGCRCGANTVRPKPLRWWHKARLVLAPWSV